MGAHGRSSWPARVQSLTARAETTQEALQRELAEWKAEVKSWEAKVKARDEASPFDEGAFLRAKAGLATAISERDKAQLALDKLSMCTSPDTLLCAPVADFRRSCAPARPSRWSRRLCR